MTQAEMDRRLAAHAAEPLTGDELNARDHAFVEDLSAHLNDLGRASGWDAAWNAARSYYKAEQDDHTEAILLAQANLQEAIGFFRMDHGEWVPEAGKSRMLNRDDAVIESRLMAALARLHMLLGERGSAMYSPATHPGVTALTKHLDYQADSARIDA